jgi:hypothetical protein
VSRFSGSASTGRAVFDEDLVLSGPGPQGEVGMTGRDPRSWRARFGLSPALVVATVALVAAVSGVAVAAPGSARHHRVRAVAASGRRGPRGFRGYTGATGATGAAGTVPAIVTVDSPAEVLPPGTYTDANLVVYCPSGYYVLGTGFNAGGIGTVGFVLDYGNFVGGFISNQSSAPISSGVYVQAICGVVAGGSSGAHAVRATSSQARFLGMVQAARARMR